MKDKMLLVYLYYLWFYMKRIQDFLCLIKPPIPQEPFSIGDKLHLFYYKSFLVTTSLSLSCLVFVRNDNPLVTRKKMNGC